MDLEATSGGYYMVRAVHSGQCLSVDGESTDNGTALVQWPGGDGHHQRFRLG
ncbi:RICIN domain-containing protein [Streptomyces sp. CAS3]